VKQTLKSRGEKMKIINDGNKYTTLNITITRIDDIDNNIVKRPEYTFIIIGPNGQHISSSFNT
jgi:hypothetical protein